MKTKQTIPNAAKVAKQLELSYIAGGNAKWGNHFAVWSFLIKLNIHLSYDSEIPLLDIYPGEKNTVWSYSKICMQMFKIVSFTII